MRLRNRHTVVAPASQGESPRPWAPRATMLLYFVLLAALAGVLVLLFGERALYFKARGQVYTDKTVLSSTRGGRITELRVQPGDTIARGELLAHIETEHPCAAPGDDRARRIRSEQSLDRLQLTLVRERLEQERARLERLDRRRALELDGAGPEERDRIVREVARLREEQRLLDLKLRLQSAEADQLTADAAPDPECVPAELRAPYAGVVYSAHQERYQVVDAGDPILTLEPRGAAVGIMAYLELGQLSAVTPGTSVQVRFPDGTTDQGRVAMVRSSAQPFARLEHRGYQAAEAEVLAEIEPVDPGSAPRWRKFDRFDVQIRGWK